MTSRIARLGLLALAALVAAPTFATPSPAAGRIVGVVTDAQTGDPLLGASARIAGTSIGAATDMEGRFSIPSAPSGPQQLVVSYVGYVSDTLTVDVPDGGTVEVEAALSFLTLEGVEVTAQVAGQLAAINEQFRDRTVVNVVSADRIQELPDNNAAESIGRLPGVAIQRSGGEANKVAIRGLSPKFNNVTVNGVRLAGTDGGDRSVDLSLISSNILDGIEVRKSITPDMDADAIGGAVNLRLRNAPSGLAVDVLGQGGYTALQDSYDNYKAVGTVSNRLWGDRLGLIATFNADRFDRSADKLGVGYDDFEDSMTGDRVLVPNSIDTREETVGRSRAGGSVLLDYTVPAGRLTANSFVNSLRNEGLVRNRNATENNLTYNVNTFDQRTTLWTSALGIEQDFGWIRYDMTGNYSRSESDSPEDMAWTFALDGARGFENGPEARYDQGIPLTAYEQEQVRSDSTLELNTIWVDETNLTENQSGVQANIQVPFRLGNFVNGYVKTGGKLRWLDRTYDRDRYGRQGLQYPNANLFECLSQSLPQYESLGGDNPDSIEVGEVLLDYTRTDDFFDGEFGLGLVPNEALLTEITRALQSDACADPGDTPYATEFVGQYHPETITSLGGDYSGTENYQAAYVMAELSLGDYVTVIPGVRYERDNTVYDGQRFRTITNGAVFAPPGDFTELTAERTFDYWLPMVHVDIRPLDWLSLRLARTETLARPNYNQYAPITSIDQFNSNVNAANSRLRPSQATNYDVSLQVVRGDLGLVGVSGFHKTIDDLVIGVSIPVSSDLDPPEGTNIPPAWYQGFRPFVTTNVNSPEPATFYGYELEWQTNFSYLPGALKGIVLNLNYTRTFSETTYFSYRLESELIPGRPPRQVFTVVDTTRAGRVADQPAHVANVTLGYDYKGFSTRLSYLFQSNTTAGVNSVNPLFDQFVGDYSRFDLSVRQQLRTGIELFANLNNLNSRPDQRYTYQNSVTGDYEFADDTLSYRELYGFTVDVGARYRF